MNNKIVMINRSKLKPHPDNPRKDLGDLTELADSIAEHGIMQNLTVVPYGDDDRVLIGHRRLAASKGIIDELPCVIADNLTDREQGSVGNIQIFNIKTNDKDQLEELGEKYMEMDTLLKVLMNVWAALASNYSNRFVDYNHVKREDVLDAHNSFYSILYFFGFRLNEELTKVIEGESDLYLIDGKEVES